MSRNLTAAVATEVQKDEVQPIVLAELDFPSGFVRVWSGIGQLTWNGVTWEGTGALGTVSVVEETVDLRAVGLNFTLTGVDSSLLSIALGEDYRGRSAKLYLGFLDSTGVVIVDPTQIWGGRIDTMESTDAGETATIILAAESRLVDLERPGEIRRYTDEDQQREFPGDEGLAFVNALQEAVIFWGRREENIEPSRSFAPARQSRQSRPGGGGGRR